MDGDGDAGRGGREISWEQRRHVGVGGWALLRGVGSRAMALVVAWIVLMGYIGKLTLEEWFVVGVSLLEMFGIQTRRVIEEIV